jgi:hypothetical protein
MSDEETKPKEEATPPTENKPAAEEKKDDTPLFDRVVDELTENTFDALMKEAEKQVKMMPNQTKSYAEEGIDFLKKHKGELVGLGKEGLSRFLHLLGLGEKAQARDHYIKTKLGPDELIALMSKNAEEIAAAADKKKEFNEQANAFLVGLSRFTYRIVAGLLLA